MALIYIVVSALVVLALSDWATNDLSNTKGFNSASALDYAATSATDVAIQSIRYSPIPTTAGSTTVPGECWNASGGVSSITVDNFAITVWCTSLENLASPQTRIVSFYACPSSVSGTACAAAPSLAAVVAFDDYPPGNAILLSQQCNAYPTPTCGEGMTIQSWNWNG